MRPPLSFTLFFYNKVFIFILRTRCLWFTFPFHLSRTLLLGLRPRCSHFLCMPFLSTSSISTFCTDCLRRCLLFIFVLLIDVNIFVPSVDFPRQSLSILFGFVPSCLDPPAPAVISAAFRFWRISFYFSSPASEYVRIFIL